MNNYQEEELNIEIGQINLDIPYRKINSLEIQRITPQKVDSLFLFEICFKYKLEGPMKTKTITRNLSDFEWLVSSLKSYQNKFVIIPNLQTFQNGSGNSSIFSYVSKKMTETSKKQINNQDETHHEMKYDQKVIQRFLKILSQISLKYMYHKPGQFENPLYIFIQDQDQYNFYRPLYEQEKKKNQSLLKGYLTGFLDYMPSFAKKKSNDAYGLEPMYQSILKLYNKGVELLGKLKDHHVQLGKLYENFIKKEHREQLKIKKKKVDSLMLRLEQNVQYVHLIMNQIQQNLDSYREWMQKAGKDVEAYINQEIQSYLNFIDEQKSKIDDQMRKIGKQFIEVNINAQSRAKIDIGDIYPNYQKVK